MRTIRNFNGDKLADVSVPSATEDVLLTMMSALPASELKRRVRNIKDQDTRVLAQAHMDAMDAMADWDGPIRE